MYRLILIDDEPHVRKGLQTCYPWQDWGFSVVEAFENGHQALDYILHYQVDAVVSDVRMPVMDGMEFIRNLRDRGYSTPVLFISGYSDFDYVRQALVYDATDYVLKPVKTEKLAVALQRIRKKLEAMYGEEMMSQPEGYYDKIIDQVMRYVMDNCRTATLEQAAAGVGLSPNYLSKIFKKKTGRVFSDYLTEVKMKKAARLLKDIRIKTYQIAYEVGYENPKNFSRAFRAYYGKSPREYRDGGTEDDTKELG
ncbi:response regulator [uncultured Ruthenibacterium sp.]|uniref:response regulator transcription factor n=1 Tax=uncultured Ruthenibacterium sp. TaxID=1905347 RepID=UPI00349E9944